MFRTCVRLGLVAGLGLVLGCSPEPESGPKLTGKLVIDGKPCRPVSLYDFEVKFLSVGGEGPIKKSYIADVQEDGTFTVNGSIGKGIPTGKYKLIISGPVLDETGKPTRRFMGTYTDKETPLEVDIGGGSRNLVIDLERKTAELS